MVVRHINRNYCGKPVDGTDGGDIELMQTIGHGQPFRRAISVGGGNGHHEICLLRSGLVGAVDMFEIAPARARRRPHIRATAAR